MSIIKVVGLDPSMNNFGMVKADLNLDTLDLTNVELLLSQPVIEETKTVRQNSKDLEKAKQHWEKLQSFIPAEAIVFVEVPVGSQSA